MLRGIPTRMVSNLLLVEDLLQAVEELGERLGRMNSSGWAIIFSSSLTATPIRTVPWSRASILMG